MISDVWCVVPLAALLIIWGVLYLYYDYKIHSERDDDARTKR